MNLEDPAVVRLMLYGLFCVALIFLIAMAKLFLDEKRKIKGLFLDDERSPMDVTWMVYPKGVEWTIVRNVPAFLFLIQKNNYDLISFDHDLGAIEGPNTSIILPSGKDALNKMIQLHMDGKVKLPTQVLFHSKNVVGLANMKSYWESYQSVLRNGYSR